MKSPRFPALVAFVLGLCVLFDVGDWTLSAVQSSNSDSDHTSLVLWIACFAVVLASTAMSGWLLLRSSTTSGMIVAFTLCGIAIAVVGTLAYYIDAMMAAQALFYHSRDASRSLLVSRVGLGFSVGTFVMCIILFMRTILVRR
jgi:hypothetical protein